MRWRSVRPKQDNGRDRVSIIGMLLAIVALGAWAVGRQRPIAAEVVRRDGDVSAGVSPEPTRPARLFSNDRFIALALLFVIVVPSAWAVYHERSLIQRLGQAETSLFRGAYQLTGQGAAVLFQRDSGAGRPHIMDEDGTLIAEYSDWSDSSRIFVGRTGGAGNSEMLFLHAHGYAVAKDTLSHSIHGDTWDLIQNVAIIGPRTVKVEYYYVTRAADVTRVQLALSHYHWYFQSMSRSDTGFTAQVTANVSRSDIDRGVVAPPRYDVSLRTDTPQALSKVDPIAVGFADEHGVANIVTRYEVNDLQRDVMTLVASEVVSWVPAGQ